MPPPSALDKWTLRKVKGVRDKKGKFLKRKTVNFLIARAIFKRGSETTNFFTIPIARSEKRFEAGLDKALEKDIENNIQKNI